MTMATVGSRFRYRAVRADGRMARGVIIAEDVDRARAKLVDQRLMPIELVGERRRAVLRPIGDADLALGAHMLRDLLGSGLALARALNAFGDLAPDTWRVHVPRIAQDVRAGASLSAAFRNLNGAVPPLLVGLVRAGEIGGGLPAALDTAASLYDATAATRRALLAALAYPAFLLVVCVGSVALLGGVVLPRFTMLLAELGQQLPASTAFLVSAAAAVRRWAPLALALSVGGGVLFGYWLRTPAGQLGYHRALLRLPVLGAVRRAWAAATVCSTTSALVQAGVVIPSALQHAAAACSDRAVAERVMSARQDILNGAHPSDALERHAALTTLAVKLLRAGEETGRLATTLDRAAVLERARAMALVQAAVRMIEPTLIIGFGLLVAFIATALLQAVYAIRPA